MGRAVNLVVSCTNRKRYETAPGLSVRQLVGPDVQTRLRAWKDRLKAVQADKCPAEDLYIGEHWSVVRDIPSEAKKRGWNIQLWICSAGYGLIQPETHIHSYQAAFTPGGMDAVAPGGRREAQDWWKGVCSLPIPDEQGFPRTLTTLALRFPRTPMIVALSADYLKAVEEDLRCVLDLAFFHRHLSIISCGTRRENSPWKNNLLPCDGGHSTVLGGTLTSLNARVARFLFGFQAHTEPTVDYWSSLVQSIEKRTAPPVCRAPQSDAKVSKFIRAALRNTPSASKTKLLEEFRATGKACEQKRFGELYIRLRQGAQPDIHG